MKKQVFLERLFNYLSSMMDVTAIARLTDDPQNPEGSEGFCLTMEGYDECIYIYFRFKDETTEGMEYCIIFDLQRGLYEDGSYECYDEKGLLKDEYFISHPLKEADYHVFKKRLHHDLTLETLVHQITYFGNGDTMANYNKTDECIDVEVDGQIYQIYICDGYSIGDGDEFIEYYMTRGEDQVIFDHTAEPERIYLKDARTAEAFIEKFDLDIIRQMKLEAAKKAKTA